MDYINFLPTDPRNRYRFLDVYRLITEYNGFNPGDTKDTFLYFLEFTDKKHRFHKIGITKRTVEDRFRAHKAKYIILDLLKVAEKDARYLERKFLGLVDGPYQFSEDHEMVKLGGYTECFYPDKTRTTFSSLLPTDCCKFRKQHKTIIIDSKWLNEIYDY